MIVRYLSHPQVRIDPQVPVPHWGLSDVGHARVAALIASGALAGTRHVFSSAEVKALETAEPIARALGASLSIRAAMHENDRSATGFLPPPEFEAVANEFFANPEISVRGWERAVDAQARIVAETRAALSESVEGDVLLVGHGGVGTLLLCHVAGHPIRRIHDQPAGGGNVFAFSRDMKSLLYGWRAMEDTPPAN